MIDEGGRADLELSRRAAYLRGDAHGVAELALIRLKSIIPPRVTRGASGFLILSQR